MKKQHTRHSLFILMLAVFVVVPHLTHAQDETGLAQQSIILATQTGTMARFFAILSYALGVAFAAKGLFSLQAWVQDSGRNPLAPAIGALATSSLLIVLPYFVGMAKNTLGGNLAQQDISVKATAEQFVEKGMDDVADKGFRYTQQKITKQTLAVPRLMAVMGYVGGVFFIAAGLIKLKDWMNDSSRNPINAAIFRFLAGGLMIAFPHILFMTTSSLFAYQDGGQTAVQVNVTTPIGQLSPFKEISN